MSGGPLLMPEADAGAHPKSHPCGAKTTAGGTCRRLTTTKRCPMHGSGTQRRVREGDKQDPALAGVGVPAALHAPMRRPAFRQLVEAHTNRPAIAMADEQTARTRAYIEVALEMGVGPDGEPAIVGLGGVLDTFEKRHTDAINAKVKALGPGGEVLWAFRAAVDVALAKVAAHYKLDEGEVRERFNGEMRRLVAQGGGR